MNQRFRLDLNPNRLTLNPEPLNGYPFPNSAETHCSMILPHHSNIPDRTKPLMSVTGGIADAALQVNISQHSGVCRSAGLILQKTINYGPLCLYS